MTADGRLSSVRALAFDVNGTILDWHSGIAEVFADIGARRGLDRDWAALANVYNLATLNAIKGQVKPAFTFDDVLVRSLDDVLAAHGLREFTAEDRAAVVARWRRLGCWPDSRRGLDRLRTKYACAAFSVLTTGHLIAVSRINGLDWDAVISCEMIGTYKTAPEAYAVAARWLGFPPDEIAMVACHPFDLDAASDAGYRTAFVPRPAEYGAAGSPSSAPRAGYDRVATDMEALAGALGC